MIPNSFDMQSQPEVKYRRVLMLEPIRLNLQSVRIKTWNIEVNCAILKIVYILQVVHFYEVVSWY